MINNPFQQLEEKLDEGLKEIRELKQLLEGANKNSLQPEDEKPYIYSIAELANFLDCSIVVAQKMKNEKRFPFYQSGRKVMFKKSEILAALKVNSKTK